MGREQDTDDFIDELYNRAPTLYKEFNISIRGWDNDDEDEARVFAEEIYASVHFLSRLLDLSRLEALIIATNYKEALASFEHDAGVPPTSPTSNEYGQGFAMAQTALRNEEIWSIVIIWMPLIRPFLDKTHPYHNNAFMTLFHELVHVSDMRLFSKTYPGGWQASKAANTRDAILQGIVNPCQSEYSAQRRSACFTPEYGLELLDMVEKSLKDVDEQIRTARLAYRRNGDVSSYWSIIASRLRFLFQAIGYGIGHADWVAEEAEKHPDLAAQYANKLKELAALPNGWLLDACREAVQPFFAMTGWKDISIFDPLVAILEKLLNDYGMFTRPDGENMYIDMPIKGLRDL